jgi:hypothetical protein
MDAEPVKGNLIASPVDLQVVRAAVLKAIGELRPAGAPESEAEARGIFLASRTKGGRDLPPYYLVYFLFVDLLGFPNWGQSEKVAWTVPVRFQGKLYVIEHCKMGLGIFAPTLEPNATTNAVPSKEAEADSQIIASLIKNGIAAAKPYFEWRAEQAAFGVHLNVVNNSVWLFNRYVFFRERFKALTAEAIIRKSEKVTVETKLEEIMASFSFQASNLRQEAKWNAQAAVDAFFSWTEHVFIHLAILQGQLHTGIDIAGIAAAEWKMKFKTALDLNDRETKKHYDKLFILRLQVRNFMAHGAFGKRGEAFRFHSGAGAVPVLLTESPEHRFSLTGEPGFDEGLAIAEIEEFIQHLWSGARLPAREYIFSGLPAILTHVTDGTYNRAMRSVEAMKEFVEKLSCHFDRAANMDW